MRNILVALLCVASFNLLAQTEGENISQPDLKNRTDSMNYFFGLTLGYSLETAPFDTDAALISAGMTRVLEGKSAHDHDTSQKIFQNLHRAMSLEKQGSAGPGAMENLERGNAFLTENGKREGITTSESGLQYEVLSIGDGPKPEATSTVEVHYEGTLVDGTVFDSSYDRGKPISFPLNQVIAGWTEGVQKMSVGSIYKFYIPSKLAYGERDAGKIPPNSALIFKIELLEIK